MRGTGCIKCGRPMPPKPQPPIMHHCHRCLRDLEPGHTGAMLYHLVDGHVATSMQRFCSDCEPIITERAMRP